MKKRLISLLLAVLLLAAVFPLATPAGAVSSEKKQELCDLIVSTYKQAKRICYVSSFNGLCGAAVSAQTYALGIDTTRYGCDGKDQFNMYARLSMTTGGYKVRSYPASRYTLRTALNEITNNGKWDVYNLMVGFQSTNTVLGSQFGHSLLIYGILDGMVYFAESYPTSWGGKYIPEGQPIICSMEEFCRSYERWTVFDGIAYFGRKTYADQCAEFSANLTYLTNRDTLTYLTPGDSGVCEPEPGESSLLWGQKIRVDGILKTPGGAWWLRLDDHTYIPAEAASCLEQNWDDVSVSNLKVPGVLRKGYSFYLGGIVSAVGSRLTQATVSVYAGDALQFSGTMQGSGNTLALSDSKLDSYLTFRQLSAGSYRMVITVTAEQNVLTEGEAQTSTREFTLFDGQFRVVPDWKSYPVITFDGNGGTVQTHQRVLDPGKALTALPEAHRDGAAFLGWALDPQGTQMVTEDYIPTAATRLYAQWDEAGVLPQTGWVNLAGMRFYLDDLGQPLTQWQQIDGRTYYFSPMGVQQEGWLEQNGVRRYLYPEGGLATSWCRIDGREYLFSSEGVMRTGWVSRYGTACFLQPDGVLTGMGHSMSITRCTLPGSLMTQPEKRHTLCLPQET